VRSLILVDINVPVVGKTYDFQLDENAYIYDLLEEISEMIATSEQMEMVRTDSQMMLCSYESHRILPQDMTLSECGIKTGNRLIFV
jgi:uncharacterized ubiquitin-like protein YukD